MAPVRILRILGFGALIGLTPQLLGVAHAILMAPTWHWFTDSPESAMVGFRIARRAAIALTVLALYVWFLRPIHERQLMHVAALFLVATLAVTLPEVAMGSTVGEAMPLTWIGAHVAIVCAAAWISAVMAGHRSNKSMEPARDR